MTRPANNRTKWGWLPENAVAGLRADTFFVIRVQLRYSLGLSIKAITLATTRRRKRTGRNGI